MTLSEEFMANGIVKIPVEDLATLHLIKNMVWLAGTRNAQSSYGQALDTTHWNISNEQLNEFRLNIIKEINEAELGYFKKTYYFLAKNALHELVGNELVMQRNINLSIQLPGDDSSLLPVHCDTWSGGSPYEVVLWVPLVDVWGTKSMFFCDKKVSESIDMGKYKNSEELFHTIEPDVKFMDVKYGEALIFTQNIMHGNRINETNETRWSLNCRFKSLFSPYGDKRLGEFFEPVEIRPATRFGLDYVYPKL